MNTSTQLKALIRNLAKDKSYNFFKVVRQKQVPNCRKTVVIYRV